MSTQNKRLRAPNFTTAEGLRLCSIIERYKSIVENKTTDGASLLQKQEAWIEITNEFNASGPNYFRSIESLQNCYKKLKQKAKKQHSIVKMNIPVNKEKLISAVKEIGLENWDAVSSETQIPKEECETAFNTLIREAKKNEADIKKFVMGTGPPCNNEDVLLNKVKGLIKGSVEGMYTVFDGDSELMAECSTGTPIDTIIYTEPKLIPCTNESSQKTTDIFTELNAPPMGENSKKSVDLFTTNRSNLKRKKDAALKDCETPKTIKKRETVLGNFSELAERKINFVKSQEELLTLQLKEENNKINHSSLMRQMEMEATKVRYQQEEQIREQQLKILKLDVLLKEKQLNS